MKSRISADKRKHTQQITALKNQIKGEQEYSDEQEALLGLVTENVSCSEQNRTLFDEHFFVRIVYEPSKAEINKTMEPYKKQNKMLMGIINAAEKGHNMLLSTMQNINNEISGNL